jgi:hypothetical protein
MGNTWFIARSKLQDQCLLSVFSIRSFTETATLSQQQHTPAGVAQRKSA